jgi:hypothetical protein
VSKFENVRIELNTVGIGKVLIGDKDISGSVREVDISSRAGELTVVTFGLVPGSVSLTFAEADIETREVE